MNSPKNCRLDLDCFLQRDLISDFIPRIGKNAWQIVYAIDDNDSDRFSIFSALLEPQSVREALEKDEWDLAIGGGLPGFNQSLRGNITSYHRFGTEGIRPLVICRDFHGAWPSYSELCEEFRHFHNLAEDRQRQILLDFDESRYEVEVVRITEHKVEINWKYLLQFLAATQLYLCIYFDSVRYSQLPLQNVPEQERVLKHSDKSCRYLICVEECDFQQGYHTFSRLLGKVIIEPPPIEKCGKWPFKKRKTEQEVSFIIDISPDGEPKEFTSNPDKLSNYFGANPEAPRYLTPVYFRKNVLEKYYAEPERYSVEDGYLRCLGLWGMQIDNNHPTYVITFLGDLGRDLPYRERLHWKQFNVLPPAPADANISEIHFRRSFLAEFTHPESVDLVFRQEYQRLNNDWRDKLGWPLFLDPEAGDEYALKIVHIPGIDSQRELDQQILILTKLLVDSLNEKEFDNALPEKRHGEKGIDKLERFLESRRFAHTEEVIHVLRNLQRLRSTGTAHRKGTNYQKTLERLGLTGKRESDVMNILLAKAVKLLYTLREFCKMDSEK